MSILSSGFLDIRNKYIIPLLNIDINNDSYEQYELKSLLLNAKFNNVTYISKDKFEFEFDRNIFLRSIKAEFEMYYSKSFIQNINIMQMKKLKLSLCWLIVSDYYKYFYYSVALTRLCMRGLGFLDNKAGEDLSEIISGFLNDVYKINRGNYQYEARYGENENEDKIFLKIQFNTKTSHESVWNLVKDLFENMIHQSSIKDKEELILKTLLRINTEFSNSFMSNIRNDLNYKGKYAKVSLEDKIHYSTYDDLTEKEYIQKITRFINTNEESSKYFAFALYGRYLQIFVEALYKDYFERVEENKRNKYTFHKLRIKYISNRNLPKNWI